MWQFFEDFLRYVDRMSRGEWLLLVAAVLVVGVICMRGLGSRSSY